MKNDIITYSKPGKHTLFKDGKTLGTFPTEIELVQFAKTKGINFKELRFTPCNSQHEKSKNTAFTNWYK